MPKSSDHITQTCPLFINDEGYIADFHEGLIDVLSVTKHQLTDKKLSELLDKLNPGWGDQFESFLRANETTFTLEASTNGNNKSTSFYLEFMVLHQQELTFLNISKIETSQELFEGSIKDLLEDPARVSQLYLRLQRAESRLESYMQHFPGVFFYQRSDFSFQYISPNFQRLLGFQPDRLLRSGSQFLGMIYDQDRDFFVGELQKHSKGRKPFTMQYRMRKPKDNSVIYLTDVRTPIFSTSGMLLGYEGVWLDTTRQIIAERKLTSTTWKENLAMLTAGLVHDFSNVMAGIYALSELYHSNMKEEDEMYEGLGQIKKSSMEARKLVRRIIDINREQAGQKNYHDPKKLIYEQLDLLKIIFPRGTQIDLDLCGDEIPVFIDDVEFRQILLNLALNSKDALKKQGVINIQTQKANAGDEIFANASKGPFAIPKDGILLSFKDNGTGIPEVYRDRIFNSFFTTKEIHKGSGFGLYNIQRMVQAVGGIIDFETEENEGTTFHIYLPEADFTEQSSQQQDGIEIGFHPVEQRTLVVIYCNEDASQFDLVSMLRSKNWEVIVFNEAVKLESYLRDTKRYPNLCIFIDAELDTKVPKVCSLFKKIHPDTLFVLHAMGRNPDEIPESHTRDMALICDGAMNPNKIVENLEKLVRTPLTIVDKSPTLN